jgi:hypothetical protein
MKPEALAKEMVARLQRGLDRRLSGVILHGPAVRGDWHRGANLLLLTTDLEVDTLGRLAEPVRWWLRRGQPWPRLFTAELMRDAVDVYPIELLDIAGHHRMLHGADPLGGIEVDRGQLRLQCERELREKLMRLREGYVEARGRRRALDRLLGASYGSLAPVWGACLHLLETPVPERDREVADALCDRLGLERTPFDQVSRVAAGAAHADRDLFSRYAGAIAAMVARIDRILTPPVQLKGALP